MTRHHDDLTPDQKMQMMKDCLNDHHAKGSLELKHVQGISYFGCPWCPYKILYRDPSDERKKK